MKTHVPNMHSFGTAIRTRESLQLMQVGSRVVILMIGPPGGAGGVSLYGSERIGIFSKARGNSERGKLGHTDLE